uniref:ANK_REP_REGION domain-containing protein n=1 Tax=Steinernema glaseri TaxID=37863 RepID=A0A1I7Y075_9BILA
MTEHRAPQLPPRPAPKPGRIKVFRAISDFENEEISFVEGDFIYVSETQPVSDRFIVKCNGRSGHVDKSQINNDSVVPVENALHEAARRGNLPFLDDCLQNEVSVNSLDKSGSTPLYWAAHGGHTAIVEYLLSKPNISISSQNKMGDTPLHAASWKGHLECAKLLVEAGANVHTKNVEKQTPYDIATTAEVKALLLTTMRNVAAYEENEYASSEEED